MLPLGCHQNSQHSSRHCILWNPTAYHTSDGEQGVRGNINTKETGEEKTSCYPPEADDLVTRANLISFSGLGTTKLVKKPYYWTWLSKQVVRDCLRKTQKPFLNVQRNSWVNKEIIYTFLSSVPGGLEECWGKDWITRNTFHNVVWGRGGGATCSSLHAVPWKLETSASHSCMGWWNLTWACSGKAACPVSHLMTFCWWMGEWGRAISSERNLTTRHLPYTLFVRISYPHFTFTLHPSSVLVCVISL